MATENSTGEIAGSNREWRRPTSFYNRYVKYGAYIAAIGFVLWSLIALLEGVTTGRILAGAGYGAELVRSMAPPDTSTAAIERTQRMMLESIAMAMVATVTGIALSVPIAFGAAGNLVPKPVYGLNRGLISISRAVDGLIVAIIAVKAVGLGPLAGIIAITFKTVGFFSKLLAEDLEDIDMGALEATRATGATGFQAVLYGVVPQVVPRFVGLAVYRWDINIRASTIIGIVGAGGIGTLLMQAFSRYEYDFVATILLAIIAVVLVGEITSAVVRKRVQ